MDLHAKKDTLETVEIEQVDIDDAPNNQSQGETTTSNVNFQSTKFKFRSAQKSKEATMMRRILK